ncbi:NAD(P)H-dependent oxidoreductase [Peptococcus simiae]|uniref:NAD(P)H-dependent oxidoreductase n=1 Tax=Peptococcus simiae TaxID=1643805 RepID=A0ABW9GVQ7_9FIRM
MNPLAIVAPPAAKRQDNKRLDALLRKHLPPDALLIEQAEDLDKARGRHILFAVSLDESGMNAELDAMKRRLARDPSLLHGSTGALLVDGPGDLFTKSVAREIVFYTNRAGCAFIPKALVEGIGDLYNFELRAQLLDTDLASAYGYHLAELVDRLQEDRPPLLVPPARLLAVAATSRMKVANTVCFWELVREALPAPLETDFMNLGKGQIADCRGCSYAACTERGCPDRDLMVESGFDRVAQADALLVLAPNLNDGLGPDLVAFINRLTHLANTDRITGQWLYAIIVSGYSGSDLLARQLLNAFCLNKGFRLPPYFAAMVTANRPRAILERDHIKERARLFARQIAATLAPVD